MESPNSEVARQIKSESLDVETIEFRISTGYVRSRVIILEGMPRREVKTLNISSTNFGYVSELIDAVISSNASRFRSPIPCYNNLRQEAEIVLVRDTDLMCKLINRLGRGTERLWGIIGGESDLSRINVPDDCV